jgi:alpha-tubulin suppressor-like RCC1 family protein
MTLAVPAAGLDPASAASKAGRTAAPVPEVLGWGNNRQGDLGDGMSGNSDVPVPVTLPAGTRVAVPRAGFSHSIALTSSGQVLI